MLLAKADSGARWEVSSRLLFSSFLAAMLFASACSRPADKIEAVGVRGEQTAAPDGSGTRLGDRSSRGLPGAPTLSLMVPSAGKSRRGARCVDSKGSLSLTGVCFLLLGEGARPGACDDLDGDGYGNPASASCPKPGGDCDDANPGINPGATEGPPASPSCIDGLDNDCDGAADGSESGCREGLSLLPDTGITTCYGNNAAIECPVEGEPFYGQDAQYTANPMSFTVSPDGLTVTDNVTGLMWQRCSAGLSGADCSAGQAETRTWATAITYCEALELPPGGYTDWRLPGPNELQSIVDYGRYSPKIDAMAFPGSNGGGYWSSSSFAYVTGYAWWVCFYTGQVFTGPKVYAAYVRCVR